MTKTPHQAPLGPRTGRRWRLDQTFGVSTCSEFIRRLPRFCFECKGVTVADVVDRSTRSRMMAGIRGKNTKPEILLRKALHAQGIRFRLHAGNVPGRPDIVFPRYRAVCFVHGCFWHQHPGCRYAATPKTRPEFWQLKFAANSDRDKVVMDLLRLGGWRVAIVWECTLKSNDPAAVAGTLKEWLNDGSPNQLYRATDPFPDQSMQTLLQLPR